MDDGPNQAHLDFARAVCGFDPDAGVSVDPGAADPGSVDQAQPQPPDPPAVDASAPQAQSAPADQAPAMDAGDTASSPAQDGGDADPTAPAISGDAATEPPPTATDTSSSPPAGDVVPTHSTASRADTRKGPPAAAKDPKGSRKVDIQITLVNWDNAPIIGYQGLAEFKSPGVPDVTLGSEIKGGVISFTKVALMPQGTLRVLAISKGEAATAPSGVVNYKLPDKGLMTFTATQGRKVVKVSAKTSQEASDKVGVKGTLGIDYKIVKAEGEISGETEKKKGSEVSTEWEVVLGLDLFDVKQAS